MTYREEFLKILEQEREDDILPFFKRLPETERKEFYSYLKFVCKEYLEFKENKLFGALTFKRKASDKQADLLTLAALICFNRKDFEDTATIWSLKPNSVNPILEWYCPSWFDSYINAFAQQEFTPQFLTYEWIIELSNKKFVQPSRELIAKTLPATLFETNKDHKSFVREENLLRHEITLREHIWYIFDTDNNIYLSDRYLDLTNQTKRETSSWIPVLKKFADSQLLDRSRLIRESMLGSTRNFNKLLTGWFADLFEALEPSVEELLPVQSSLQTSLNSPHSKAVNVALSAFKRIAANDEFDVEGFLHSVPVLLSSEVKSIVTSTIAILEKIAKKHADRRDEIALLLCHVFIMSDETLQTRAAKIIVANAKPVKSSPNVLLRYKDSLLVNAREILKPFLPLQDPADQIASLSVHDTTQQKHEIAGVENLDELIFLVSQAFDNNKPYHIDLLPAALIKFDEQIRGEVIFKLEPALQRALKLVMSGPSGETGQLDQLLAIFFIDYAKYLISNFPDSAGTLSALYDSFKRKEDESKKEYLLYSRRIVPLVAWKAPYGQLYESHKSLLIFALDKIASGNRLPLLSTPTHEPAMLSSLALVERALVYEQSAIHPNPVDLEMAISRCDGFVNEEVGQVLQRLSDGEMKQLLSFHLLDGPAARNAKYKSAWLAAGVLKPPAVFEEIRQSITSMEAEYFSGQFGWKCIAVGRKANRYNYAQNKVQQVNSTEKNLIIEFEKPEVKESFIAAALSKLRATKIVSTTTQDSTSSVYQRLRVLNVFGQENDIARIFYLLPRNPEPLLAQVISKAMKFNTFPEVGDLRLVTNTIAAILPLDVQYKEMGHLFVASCMLSSDKTIQTFAAEMWIKHAMSKHLTSMRLGQIIGEHESIEFAPLKRFTDLVAGSMMNVSPQHNQELEILLRAVILKIPVEPITGLKKLLELYFEIISRNNSRVPKEIISHIEQWKNSSTMKKAVGSLMSYPQ